MAEIKNENHIVIHGWMRKELGLKGNELMAYALIYGFSQDGETRFRGKVQFVQEWLGVSKKTAITVLQNLTARGLITKERGDYGKFEYGVNTTPDDGEEITPTGCKNYTDEECKNYTEAVKNLHRDGVKITPPYDNTSDNTSYIKEKRHYVSPKEKTDKPSDTPRFIPPTLEEIKAYCEARGNAVDCERFYDFYQSKGWMVGKNKMKDWRAAVRTWERTEHGASGTQSERKSTGNPFLDLLIAEEGDV